MLLSPKLKWKINRYGQDLDRRLEKIRGFFKSVTYKQKMCPACRALVDRGDKVCPFCGENIATAPRGGIGLVLSHIVPERARYTAALLGINLVLYALSFAASVRHSGEFDLGSLLGSIDNDTLVRMGAKYGLYITAGQWWRFITPMFLHANLIHLAFNSIVLFDLGPAVEQIYGSHKYIVLYIVAGAVGFVVSYLLHPLSVSVGASGALFGLIGVMVAYGQRHRSSIGESVKSMYVRWAIYGLIYGFILPGADNAAHLGGLGAGLLFGAIVTDMPSITRESILFWKIMGSLAIAAALFSFVMLGLRQPM